MPRSKPAIGVTHAMIDGIPRVMIALYLNHPSVQVTKDDDGGPIALAALEPEAAIRLPLESLMLTTKLWRRGAANRAAHGRARHSG
jgi:hypothetical protein